jgi:hypothetical protein
MAKKAIDILVCTTLMIGGGAAAGYGIIAPEQLLHIRVIVCLGIAAVLAGSLGLQLMWWAEHERRGVERRVRPRYPEDLGPGPSGRRPRRTR